jgi:hypothetical protein
VDKIVARGQIAHIDVGFRTRRGSARGAIGQEKAGNVERIAEGMLRAI